ncbi:MAG: hypothetical protein QG665_514 [Patescibacteria group bacterium]|nr:hypothetical protein [Patescibacteria group bacterium]
MIIKIETGIYKHYKGGEYQVLGVVSHSETLEPMVLYKHLSGPPELWVRPASMFTEDVNKSEYKYKGPRFVLVNKKPGLNI